MNNEELSLGDLIQRESESLNEEDKKEEGSQLSGNRQSNREIENESVPRNGSNEKSTLLDSIGQSSEMLKQKRKKEKEKQQ